jgi:hypothetical protein
MSLLDRSRRIALIALAAIVAALPASAEVTRVEITSRADLSFAGYEKIVGRVFFAVDPTDPHNAVVVDVDKAPRNAAGRVEFSADFSIVRPKSGGNGVAIVDIVNRGGKTVIRNFNRVGATRDPDVGDGFLLKRGFTIVAVGWEFDLPASGQPQRSAAVVSSARANVPDDLVRISVPAAVDPSGPITGIVRGTFTPDRPNPVYRVGDLAGYTPVDPTGPDSTLTVRDSMTGEAETIPRERWQLSGTTVTLPEGFQPGRLYELSFRAADPPVGGLGFVAVRDFATWIKHEPTALTSAKYVYSFGSSQSGRFLRTFLYQGFNTDERGRQVLDAVMANIAGSARLDLNRRWATPTSATALATEFPFANQALTDPVSGATDGLLENPRAAQSQPKIFYANTGVEYWSSAGRAAALTHTSPDGTTDLEWPDNARSFFFAGTQHGPGAFPPNVVQGQQRGNPTDYWWSWRALLVAMDNWVRSGTAPPPSQVPQVAAQTLVDVKDVAFPAIPGVQSPRTLNAGARVTNMFIDGGAGGGTPLPLLVPQVDADGNERAGIRHPEVVVPLATLTGWNFRNPAIGGTHQIVPLLGSYVPFARTKAEREQSGDPRLSIQERYPTRDRYLSLIKDAAAGLVRDRFLLAEDVESIVQRASAQWDYLAKPAATASLTR